jgi:Fe-S cluster assembly iron-binding protein IscA
MIEINDAAKSKIREILDNNPGKYLRVVVEGDGCAGPYFGFLLDEANSSEKTTRVSGLDILVSEEVKRYADVTTINIFVNYTGKDVL